LEQLNKARLRAYIRTKKGNEKSNKFPNKEQNIVSSRRKQNKACAELNILLNQI
jgi:hypothetical protein